VSNIKILLIFISFLKFKLTLLRNERVFASSRIGNFSGYSSTIDVSFYGFYLLLVVCSGFKEEMDLDTEEEKIRKRAMIQQKIRKLAEKLGETTEEIQKFQKSIEFEQNSKLVKEWLKNAKKSFFKTKKKIDNLTNELLSI
jgi:septal ring factor EnvC (AmiA/AmiB activator)